MTRKARVQAGVRSVEAAAVAGIVYAVAATLALVLLNRTPDDLTDAEVAAWFADGGNRTSLVTGLNLAAVSSIAFLWFVAVIRRRVGDREDQFVATTFLGAAIAYVACWLTAAAAVASPAIATMLLDAASIDASTAALAHGQGAAMILVVAPRLQAVFVLTSTTIVRRSGALHPWYTAFGYVVGLALLVTPIVSRPIGVAFPVWVLIASIAFLVARPDPTQQQHQRRTTS